MGKLHEALDEKLIELIEAQHVFFVATAPLSAEGHVNLSPKGYDAFRVLDPRRVAYADLVGSGIETVAHLRENGRITIMFCAFEGPPKIVRLQGKGRALEPGDPEFDALLARFPSALSPRAIVVVELERIASSCGYAVPFMRFEGDRPTLLQSAQKKGPEGLRAYAAQNNRESIDGLPGLTNLD